MTSTEIKSYWDDRAEKHPTTATTNDVWLRILETRTLAKEIAATKAKRILDIGCGDAATTIRLAHQFPDRQFVGLDYSQGMLDLAARNVEVEYAYGHELHNLQVRHGGFFSADLSHIDLVISCRWLINLPNEIEQMWALQKLKDTPVRLIENFIAPHDHLNQYRAELGLHLIPIQPHNKFLDLTGSISFADSYYWDTRVSYAYECFLAGREPDYNSDRHRQAIELPNIPELFCAPMRMIVK